MNTYEETSALSYKFVSTLKYFCQSVKGYRTQFFFQRWFFGPGVAAGLSDVLDAQPPFQDTSFSWPRRSESAMNTESDGAAHSRTRASNKISV